MSKFAHLTDAELSHSLTEVRITLSSIRPYHDAKLERLRHELWAEYDRRSRVCPFCGAIKAAGDSCPAGCVPESHAVGGRG